MFKQIPDGEFYRLINFGACVVVTAKFKEITNAASIAWIMPVNDEPQLLAIAVADTHYTTELIEKSGEFVVNVIAKKDISLIKYFGSVSGRKEDKLLNIAVEAGVKLKVPHLKDCVGFLECKVKDNLSYSGVRLVVAKVLCAKVKSGLYKNGLIEQKAAVVSHIGKNVFATTGKRFKI
jgi:flavin reductase (DIM6/NTAB) family NADH-FMN oxidoreductase RutF